MIIFGLAILVGALAMAVVINNAEASVGKVIPFKTRLTMEDVYLLLKMHTPATRQDRIVGTAICWAESMGNTLARLDNGPLGGKGLDRGLWQINSHWHPEVTDEQAFDAVKATKEAWKIRTSRGWVEWSTYKSIGGRLAPYVQYLGRAEECATKDDEASSGLV